MNNGHYPPKAPSAIPPWETGTPRAPAPPPMATPYPYPKLDSMDEYPTRINDSAAKPGPAPCPTADVLEEMAATFRERNAVYGSNYRMIGPMMAILFPAGVSQAVLTSDQFHLFELVLVKLSRLAISGLSHLDSAHDAGVYCAMIEAILKEKA